MTYVPVLAKASVDHMNKMGTPPMWRVIVTGEPPYAVTQVYQIPAATDGKAAMEAIRRFVDEWSGKTPPP